MIIERKIRIISIKNGVPVNELPNDLETFILNALVQTSYWNASGSAFQSPQDFIVWLDDEVEGISYTQYINAENITKEINNTLDTTGNWLDYSFTLTVKNVIQ